MRPGARGPDLGGKGVTFATVTLGFFLGLAVGSFCNVCIHRLPQEESVISPRSRCPACRTPIRALDNVPLLSFLWLRGRCRACGAAISWRYPLVEVLTGGLFIAALLAFGPTLLGLVAAVLLAALVVVTFIDLEHQVIPDEVTLAGLPVGLLASVLLGRPPFPEALLAALGGAGALYLLAVYGELFFKREVLGGGDVKLAAMLGAFLGGRHLLLAFFLACLAGGLVGGLLLATGRAERGTLVAFGPFLAFGAAAALFFGDALWAWYWEWPR